MASEVPSGFAGNRSLEMVLKHPSHLAKDQVPPSFSPQARSGCTPAPEALHSKLSSWCLPGGGFHFGCPIINLSPSFPSLGWLIRVEHGLFGFLPKLFSEPDSTFITPYPWFLLNDLVSALITCCSSESPGWGRMS